MNITGNGFEVRRFSVLHFHLAGLRSNAPLLRLHTAADILNHGTEKRLPAQHQLEAVVTAGVMAARHGDTRTGSEVLRCKVEHRSRHHADVINISPCRRDAPDKRTLQLRAGKPAVASNADRPHTAFHRHGSENPSDLFNHIGGQILTCHSANVIRLKNTGIDHLH